MIRATLVNYLFIFGLLVNLVIPIIRFQGKNLHPVYLFSALLAIIWFYIFLTRTESVRVSSKIYYTASIMFVIFISFAFSIFFHNIDINVKYFFYEILIYAVTIPFFLLFGFVNIKENQINKVILFAFAIFFVVAVLQWLGVDRAITLYAFESHIEASRVGSRLVVTGTDPNIGSIIAAFFLMYFIASFFTNKSTFYLLLAFLALAIMFKTQGRTTIIGVGITLFLYTLFIVKINIVYKVLICILGAGFVVWFAQFFDLFYLIEGVTNLKTGSNNSVNVRLDNVNYALNNFLASPFFGWSSSLEHYGTVRNMDSEVALIMQRYGSFGLLVICVIIFKLISIGIRYRHKKLGVFILLMMSSLTFNMLTNVVFFGAQTVSIITFLIFLTYFLESNEDNYISPPTPFKP